MSQRSGNVNLQPGLGILPTLFGMQQAPGSSKIELLLLLMCLSLSSTFVALIYAHKLGC